MCVCVRGFSTVASSFDGHDDDEEEVDDDRIIGIGNLVVLSPYRPQSNCLHLRSIPKKPMLMPNPKGPSTPYLRTLGPLWVPKTINKDCLDP